jgi:hypothetical protein
MITTELVRQASCPECGHIWLITSSIVPTECPKCGHGRDQKRQVSGYSLYKGHSITRYKDGSESPTREEIDEGIESGRY